MARRISSASLYVVWLLFMVRRRLAADADGVRDDFFSKILGEPLRDRMASLSGRYRDARILKDCVSSVHSCEGSGAVQQPCGC
jgi:hypothetical protein